MENRSSSSSSPSDELNTLRQQLVVLSTREQKYEAQLPEKATTSTSEHSSSESPSADPPSRPNASPTSMQQPTTTLLYGLPADSVSTPISKTERQLQERHILWTSVTSAGQQLPLPLDSCCSVSLVSKAHADLVASQRTDLKYQALDTPISVIAADPKSDRKQLPLWKSLSPGKQEQKLCSPCLLFRVLCGQSFSIHLHVPGMQFSVQCWLDIPLKGF